MVEETALLSKPPNIVVTSGLKKVQVKQIL